MDREQGPPRHGCGSLLTRPALELAGMIRTGDISATELVEEALREIEARRQLNAFTLVDHDAALTAARAIKPGDTRPFAGVPIAIKELTSVAGQQLTMGSNLFGNYRAAHDHVAVRRLRDAGFVFVGRTNAPEFGIVPVTEPRRFGPTRNPWSPDRTPGGSSGGAAAAVAAGIVPVAHASDGGGSIRIPASCCGLVGLKASRGRISRGPDRGDDFLATDGVLTRTVADTAHLLDLLAGYEIGDATWAPPPEEPFALAITRPLRRLRIAMATVSPVGTAVDPVCAQAARDAAALLASLGHEVDEVTPPDWQAAQFQPIFTVLVAAGVANGVRFGAAVTGREPRQSLVEPLTWAYYERGITLSAADYEAAIGQLQSYARCLVAFFSTYDVLITPTLAQPPLRIGELDTCAADPLAEFEKAVVYSPFTATWNVTGQPALSLPLYHGAGGLPIGVQFIGPPLGEALLLALGAELEAALPWAERRPV